MMKKYKRPRLKNMPKDTLPWRLTALGPLVGDTSSPHRLKWKVTFKEGFQPVYPDHAEIESFSILVRPKMLHFLSLGSLWRGQRQKLADGGFETRTIQINADSQQIFWRSQEENGHFIFVPEEEDASIPYVIIEGEAGKKFAVRCSEILRSYYAACIPFMEHLLDFKGSFSDLERLTNPSLFKQLSWSSPTHLVMDAGRKITTQRVAENVARLLGEPSSQRTLEHLMQSFYEKRQNAQSFYPEVFLPISGWVCWNVIGKERPVLFKQPNGSHEYEDVFGIAIRLACDYKWLDNIKVDANLESVKKPPGSIDPERRGGSHNIVSDEFDSELTTRQLQAEMLTDASLSSPNINFENITTHVHLQETNEPAIAYGPIEEPEDPFIDSVITEPEYRKPSPTRNKVKELPDSRSHLPNLLNCNVATELEVELVDLQDVPSEFLPLIQAVSLYKTGNSANIGFVGKNADAHNNEGGIPLFKLPQSWRKRKANDRYAIALWVELPEGELFLIDIEGVSGQIYLLMLPVGIFLTTELLSYIVHRRVIEKEGWPSWDSHDGDFAHQGINHSNMDKAAHDILNRMLDHIVFLEEEFEQLSF